MNRFQKRAGTYRALLTPVLSDVTRKLTGKAAFSADFKEGGYNIGRLAILDHSGVRYYVSFSETEIKGRNSSFQSFSSALSQFLLDKCDNKVLCYYFLEHTGGSIVTPYFLFMYRLMKTIGVKFINPNKIAAKVTSFSDPDDIVVHKDRLRSSAKNKSTYVTRGPEGQIQIFGKTFGASKYETTLLGLALASMAKPDRIELYEVAEGGLTKLPESSRLAIQSLGNVDIITSNMTIEREEFRKNNSLRSPTFIFNLFERLGDKVCAFCDCSVPQIVQGAHIWPVAVIKRQTGMSEDRKLEKALHGSNGLWLCENHHKLFDINFLSVNKKGAIGHRIGTPTTHSKYLLAITTKSSIDSKFLDKEFLAFLDKRNAVLGARSAYLFS